MESNGRPRLQDRLPPQHLEAERGVLGAAMLDNAMIDEIVEQLDLRAADFYRDAHQQAWSHVLQLWNDGKPVDATTMAESLERAGVFSQLGGDEFLTGLVHSIPHAANGVYHAAIVKEKSVSRRLIEIATELISDGYSNQYTADQLLESVERKLLDVAEKRVASSTLTIREVVEESLERIRLRQAGELLGLRTQFTELDKITGGFQQGQLTILAARPGQGKTALAINAADHIASMGHGILFCSLEMPRQELGDRILCSRGGVSSERIQDPRTITPDDTKRLTRAYDEIKHLTFFIDDSPSRTTNQIAANARRLKRKSNIGLVIIDYLGLIDAQPNRGDSRQEVVAGISKRLRTLARDLSVPMLVLQQLNREIEKREDRRPRMSDLRESGQIEQDAHVILFLNRPETVDPNDRPGIAELFVAKNRNGRSSTFVRLAFVKENMRFDSLSTREHDAPEGQPF